MTTGLVTHLNRFALALALLLFAALGAWWWRDRTRRYEPPRWPDPRFAALVAPTVREGAGGTWIVAVNPGCPSCVRRLGELRRAGPGPREGAPLGVLLVDTRVRPAAVEAGESLAAGVWWDSTGAWRSRWGHRLYGETLVFGSDGALARVLAPSGEAAPAAR